MIEYRWCYMERVISKRPAGTTQKDIADRLNLSRSLVAGVLNNAPGVWASDETRRRIHNAAIEMNYRPNAAARSLRTGKTRNVLMAYTTPRNQRSGIFNGIFNGAVERFAEAVGSIGRQLVVSVQPDHDALLSHLRNMAMARSADAFIIWNDFCDEKDPEAEGLIAQEYGIPFVIKGRFETTHPDWFQIEYDHEGLMRTSVEHLAQLGHERIAFLGMERHLRCFQLLYEGYATTMLKLFGREPDLRLIAWTEADNVGFAEKLMTDWLDMPEHERPTAVAMGANNAAWWGIERALYRVDRRIGFGSNDLAVAGEGWGKNFLIWGEATTFESVSLEHLAGIMGKLLLCPLLLDQEPAERIVRVLPPLRRVNRMALELYYQDMARLAECDS